MVDLTSISGAFDGVGHFKVIRCTCLKMNCKSRNAGHRAQLIKIWDSGGGVVICILYTFDLFDVEDHFVVIRYTCFKMV